jgi:hypothetical protein
VCRTHVSRRELPRSALPFGTWMLVSHRPSPSRMQLSCCCVRFLACEESARAGALSRREAGWSECEPRNDEGIERPAPGLADFVHCSLLPSPAMPICLFERVTGTRQSFSGRPISQMLPFFLGAGRSAHRAGTRPRIGRGFAGSRQAPKRGKHCCYGVWSDGDLYRDATSLDHEKASACSDSHNA